MHNSIFRLVVVLSAAGVFALTGVNVVNASPGGPSVTQAKKTLCDNGFSFSKPTIVRPEVHADGWAQCDRPTDGGDPALTHNYYLSLQRRNSSGSWEFVGQHVKTSLVPWSRQTYTATAPCVPGLWRMYSSVSGTIQGRPYGPIETTSQERVVSAVDCG